MIWQPRRIEQDKSACDLFCLGAAICSVVAGGLPCAWAPLSPLGPRHVSLVERRLIFVLDLLGPMFASAVSRREGGGGGATATKAAARSRVCFIIFRQVSPGRTPVASQLQLPLESS